MPPSPAGAATDSPRIASLLPSATEIVYALGLGDRLVAVTFECDEPVTARADHAVVVGGIDTAGRTPGEIDLLVRERVAAGADLYSLDEDALARLDPELVLTQGICDVCALPSYAVEDAITRTGGDARVVSLDPHRLADVLETIESVAQAAGAPQRGRELVAGLAERLDAVTRQIAGRPRPRVAVLEWTDPPFAAGHWVPDLVTAAGGRSVTGEAGARSTPITWPDVAAAEPDIVVVAPCGYGLADSAAQAADVLALLPPGAAVWALDADGLVVRAGPRLVDGVEALAGVLHPGAVPAPARTAARRVR